MHKITSDLSDFQEQRGQLVADDRWPGKPRPTNYKLGANWYTDYNEPALFNGIWQGTQTVLKWRNEALLDWAE